MMPNLKVAGLRGGDVGLKRRDRLVSHPRQQTVRLCLKAKPNSVFISPGSEPGRPGMEYEFCHLVAV